MTRKKDTVMLFGYVAIGKKLNTESSEAHREKI